MRRKYLPQMQNLSSYKFKLSYNEIIPARYPICNRFYKPLVIARQGIKWVSRARSAVAGVFGSAAPPEAGSGSVVEMWLIV